jgi:hypothetical protein
MLSKMCEKRLFDFLLLKLYFYRFVIESPVREISLWIPSILSKISSSYTQLEEFLANFLSIISVILSVTSLAI